MQIVALVRVRTQIKNTNILITIYYKLAIKLALGNKPAKWLYSCSESAIFPAEITILLLLYRVPKACLYFFLETLNAR